MMLPTVHLNGTSKDRLIEDNRAVMGHLSRVLSAMHDASPNARDYYPQGPGAFTKAMEEHSERIKRVIALRSEMMEILAHLEGE